MKLVHRFAIVLGLLVVIALPMGLIGPTRPDTKGYDAAVTTALADGRANNSSASGAPQQQVVNGWVARDLAVVQIKQANDMLLLTHLVAALLIALVLAIVFTGISIRRKKAPQEASAPIEHGIHPALSGA